MKLKIKIDDILHVLACLFCSLCVSTFIAHFTTVPVPAILGGFFSGLFLGIGKEFADSRVSGNFWSWNDMIYNIIGSIIGCCGGFVTYLIHI